MNLRDRCVEVLTKPDRERRLYGEVRRVSREGVVELVALPGATVAVAEMLPAY
ncbi:MAG: hypothetical protein ABR587_12665 [Candidatus Binatia bacterium]